jgi:hypothetical protein
MHVTVRDAAGRRLDGLLLAASRYRLRILFRGAKDVTELAREYGQWTLPSGELVEFESVVTDGRFDLSRCCEQVFPRVQAPGPAFAG